MKALLKNPFSALTLKDWIIYGFSLALVVVSNLIASEINYFTLIATIIGATALIFISKGNAWGQILMVIFCTMYAYTSYQFRYYGEMITYLAMSLPISAMSIYTWLKNPFKSGENVVKIYKLNVKDIIIMSFLACSVTVGFYFVLRALNTPNLLISTLSVATSFLAAYMLLRRSSYYAVAYAVNDVVLIVLWVFATIIDISYLSVVICFSMFLINDLNGFISWKVREKKQRNARLNQAE